MKLPVSAKDDMQMLCRVLNMVQAANQTFGPLPNIDVKSFDILPALMALFFDPRLDNAFDLYSIAEHSEDCPIEELFAHQRTSQIALHTIGLDALADVFQAQQDLFSSTPAPDLAYREDDSSKAQSPETQSKLDDIRLRWDDAMGKVDVSSVIEKIGHSNGWQFVPDEDFHQHHIDLILASDKYLELASQGRTVGNVPRKVFDGFVQKAMIERNLDWQFDIWNKSLENSHFSLLGQTPSGLVWVEGDMQIPNVHVFKRYGDGVELARLDVADLIPPTNPAIVRETDRLNRASERLSRASALVHWLPASDDFVNILSPRGIFGYAYYLGGMGCSNNSLLKAVKMILLPCAILAFCWFGPITLQDSIEKVSKSDTWSQSWIFSVCFVIGWFVLAVTLVPKLAGMIGLYAGTIARGIGWFPRFSDNLPGTGEANRIVEFLERRRPTS